jgi:hypothetical protein
MLPLFHVVKWLQPNATAHVALTSNQEVSMSWLSILGAVLSAILPIVIQYVQKLLPTTNPATGVAFTKTELRATTRQWVVDLLTELGNSLVSKGVIPTWAQPELPLVEQLVATALDSALDAAGL